VSVPVEKLAETIVYYLDHEEERLRIVDNAYHLVTTKLVFRESIKSIMDAVNQVYQSIRPIDHRPILDIYNVPG
jgi:spore maturation protein CgeB